MVKVGDTVRDAEGRLLVLYQSMSLRVPYGYGVLPCIRLKRDQEDWEQAVRGFQSLMAGLRATKT